MISRLTDWWRRAGWNEFVLCLGILTFGLSAWAFVALADSAPDGEYRVQEERIMRALRQPDNPAQPIGPEWLLEVARDVTALGSAAVVVIVTLLALGYALLSRRYQIALLIAVAVGCGYGISSTLKRAIERERPTVVNHLVEVDTASFPSGHSMVSSVMYLTLGAVASQAIVRRREKIYFISAAVLLSLIIGLSRVYLGVHYPTDVLAGWCGGTAWALLCWWGSVYWLRRRQARGARIETRRARPWRKRREAVR